MRLLTLQPLQVPDGACGEASSGVCSSTCKSAMYVPSPYQGEQVQLLAQGVCFKERGTMAEIIYNDRFFFPFPHHMPNHLYYSTPS